jgi:hypothetical protein
VVPVRIELTTSPLPRECSIRQADRAVRDGGHREQIGARVSFPISFPHVVCCVRKLVGVAGLEPATPSSQAQWQHEQEVNYFGDFSGLCAPISGHCVPSVLISETPLRNVRAKNGRIYRDLLARPKRFELLTPRFVVWCSVAQHGPANRPLISSSMYLDTLIRKCLFPYQCSGENCF